VESRRVFKACGKTAVTARKVALQMLCNTVIAMTDALRDQVWAMTRMSRDHVAPRRPDAR
jgi:hypothetical protein